MKFPRLKSGTSVTTDWREINRLLGEVEKLERRVNKLENPNDRRNERAPTHPFDIYQTSTWLKYKVRTGYVITTGSAFEPADVETEFTLTSGVAEYWFYLDLTAYPTVKKSSTAPTWGVDTVPIGWVDTNTYSGSSRAVIHQFIHDNVFSPCVP